MNENQLQSLKIDPRKKSRPGKSVWFIFLLIIALTGAAVFYALPRKSDEIRIKKSGAVTQAKAASKTGSSTNATQISGSISNSVLTVSGYIIARERIEISPRFMGVVNWIGIKKGDAVTNNQVLVLLDDAEYKARLREAQGRLAGAKVGLEKAEINYKRVSTLALDKVESEQMKDDMRLAVDAAKATIKEIEGQIALIHTYIDWCVIKSPINGVILEKLVDPNELVTPQSFGGTRGPSTELVGLADLNDLQVEIDLNETDVAKVHLNQKCKVSPEAYPDKVYDGYVAEKAPEANRQKGTLQIKVQIKNPDTFLTPELSAKVDFLKD